MPPLIFTCPDLKKLKIQFSITAFSFEGGFPIFPCFPVKTPILHFFRLYFYAVFFCEIDLNCKKYDILSENIEKKGKFFQKPLAISI